MVIRVCHNWLAGYSEGASSFQNNSGHAVINFVHERCVFPSRQCGGYAYRSIVTTHPYANFARKACISHRTAFDTICLRFSYAPSPNASEPLPTPPSLRPFRSRALRRWTKALRITLCREDEVNAVSIKRFFTAACGLFDWLQVSGI